MKAPGGPGTEPCLPASSAADTVLVFLSKELHVLGSQKKGGPGQPARSGLFMGLGMGHGQGGRGVHGGQVGGWCRQPVRIHQQLGLGFKHICTFICTKHMSMSTQAGPSKSVLSRSQGS